MKTEVMTAKIGKIIPCNLTPYTAPGMGIISLTKILETVSQKTNIPFKRLTAPGRDKQEISDARYVYFRRAKEIHGKRKSLSQIGRLVNKDHATVLYGIRQAETIKEIMDLYNKCFGNE